MERADKGIQFQWFMDETVERYHGLNTEHVKINDFEKWLLKEQFKTIEELKAIYDLLPEGDYKGESGDWLIRCKDRIRAINLKYKQPPR
jgi:hypothetical protein